MKFVVFVLSVTAMVACNQPTKQMPVKVAMTREEAIPLISGTLQDYEYEDIAMNVKDLADDSVYQLLAHQGFLNIDLKDRGNHYVRLTKDGEKYSVPATSAGTYRVRVATAKLGDRIAFKDTLINGQACTKVVYQYLLSDFTPFKVLAIETDSVLDGERTYQRKGDEWELLYGSL